MRNKKYICSFLFSFSLLLERKWIEEGRKKKEGRREKNE